MQSPAGNSCRYQLHLDPRRLALSGRGVGPVFSARYRLGRQQPDEARSGHPCAGNGCGPKKTAQRLHLLPGRRLQSNLPRGHHSDRGSQYCSHDYQKLLRKHGFKASMSGKGNCYDNAAMETFFKTIKAELIWRHSWQTRRDAEVAIFEYINGFYNPRRRHSALGWKSPLAFERRAA